MNVARSMRTTARKPNISNQLQSPRNGPDNQTRLISVLLTTPDEDQQFEIEHDILALQGSPTLQWSQAIRSIRQKQGVVSTRVRPGKYPLTSLSLRTGGEVSRRSNTCDTLQHAETPRPDMRIIAVMDRLSQLGLRSWDSCSQATPMNSLRVRKAAHR